jgi:hypothetical protein
LTGKGNFNLFAGAPGVIFLGIFIAGSFPEVEGKYSFFPFLSPLGLRKTAGEMEWFGSSFHNFRLARTPEEKPRVIRDMSHPVPLQSFSPSAWNTKK